MHIAGVLFKPGHFVAATCYNLQLYLAFHFLVRLNCLSQRQDVLDHGQLQG